MTVERQMIAKETLKEVEKLLGNEVWAAVTDEDLWTSTDRLNLSAICRKYGLEINKLRSTLEKVKKALKVKGEL